MGMSSSSQSKKESPSLVRGVLGNWAAYFVIAASGFVMPRLMGDRIGQEMLGLWDFGWSMVSYTTLLGMGVTSATGRFVARHVELKDFDELNRFIGSAATVLAISFVLACALVACLVYWTPTLAGIEDKSLIPTARWIVVILGLNGAVQLPMGLFDGILTGLQRFDLKNFIRCACQIVGCGAMVVLLLNGFGLIPIAIAALAAEVVTDLLNLIACRVKCPQMRVNPLLATYSGIKEVMGFGGKTMLQAVARTTTYQTNGVIVSYFLGPAALAVYSRQRALVNFLTTIMNQYGNVFTPAASKAEAKNDIAALRRLFIDATEYAYYISIPMVAFLTISGGPLVSIWMGDDYRAPLVIAILSVGHLLSLAHRAGHRILAGLNRHGQAALAELIAATGSVALGVLLVGVFKLGLLGAALSVGLAVTIGGGAATGYYACKHLDLSFRGYCTKTLYRPLISSIPFCAALLICNLVFAGSPLKQVLFGLAMGGSILGVIYWRSVLPISLKLALTRRLPMLLSARLAPRTEKELHQPVSR